MSKGFFRTVLSIAAIVVPFIPGIGWIAAAAIEVGIALTENFLLGPSKPKDGLTSASTDRLTATFKTTEPRKIVFGHTALANDVRYQAYTGTNQEYLDMIVAHASHAIESVEQLWLDNELAWTSAGGAQGRYVGYLTVTSVLEGNSTNGIAIDSNWTTSCRLTGCAYSHLRVKLTGNSSSATSPFSSGVSSRMTWRGKGAKVYDPRLDSTVTGGSGSQRANDQTTWAWDDNASRTPALQELWYELGWKIGTKLAVGKGVPPARIDLASYAVGANHCDESIALAAGGTEPRYRSDGVISEGDDPGAARDYLCATMNAVLRDAGGKLALTVIVNDLATPLAPSGKSAFDQDDVTDEVQWDQTPDLSSSFNVVRGQMIDSSDTGLYQPIDFPEVSIASNDGIDRIDTVQYPFVQSNGQAQRLAKQRLQRNQYQGRLTFTGKPSFWGASLGDVLPFSHPAFGWSGKLVRCASQKISATGATDIVAVEENDAIYAWDREEAPAVVPGTPVVYDPLNHPLVVAIDGSGSTITGPASITINADYTGAPTTALPYAQQYQLMLNGVDVSASAAWSVAVNSGTMNASIGAATGILSIDASSGVLASGSVTITAVYSGATKTFVVQVKKVNAAAPATGGGGSGSGGSSSVTIGGGPTTTSLAACGTEIDINVGSSGQAVLTADYTFTAAGNNNCTLQWNRWNGSAWATAGSTATASYSRYGDPAEVVCSTTVTGLTANSAQRFMLFWKEGNTLNNISGSCDMSAVGS